MSAQDSKLPETNPPEEKGTLESETPQDGSPPEKQPEIEPSAKPETEAAAETPPVASPQPEAQAPVVAAADAPAAAEDTPVGAEPQATPEQGQDAPPTAEAPAKPEKPEKPAPKYRVGQRVWGKVIRLSESRATLALEEEGLDEGELDLVHLRDEFGNLSLAEGDGLQVYVVGTGRVIKLAPSLWPPAAEVMQRLKDAHEKGETVRGRVTGLNKGGLDVNIDGRRAFCPFSQIEIGRCEHPETYLNRIVDFKVAELDAEKRRIVLSHRAILLKERDEKLGELRAQIKEGADFEGVVMRLQPFGAFVDIGGIDGLVHVSEISFDRIDHPGQVLKKGEKVRVKVMGVTQGKDGRDRIRLSIKALLEDPWSTLDQHFHQGDIVTGTVVRVTDFGAFVKLYPGIEGLLHVSQYKPREQGGPAPHTPPPAPAAPETLTPPEGDAAEAADETAAPATPPPPAPAAAEQPPESPIPVAGQEITVKISRIEKARRRISLALREDERPDRGRVDHDASVGDKVEGVVRTVKPYGVFLDLPSVGPWVSGLLPGAETGFARDVNLRKKFPEGAKVMVEIVEIDDQGRIRLSRRALIEDSERRGPDGTRGGPRGGRGAPSVSTAPPGGFNVLADALRKARDKDKNGGT